MRVDELLPRAAADLAAFSESPLLDAELLLGELLGLGRMALRTAGERRVADADVARYAALLERRRSGEPVAYLTGRCRFWTLELAVGPGVLVPRPETELLVETAVATLRAAESPSVLDLGTGCGAIVIAIAAELAGAQLWAVDSSAAALQFARRNAATAGIERIRFMQGNWFEPVAGRRFDLVVGNPPYLGADDPHLAALASEPAAALVAGPTGLEALAEIIEAAMEQLQPGGMLLLEHGCRQGAAVRELCAAAGFAGPQTLCDLAGLERATLARRPAAVAQRG